MMSVEDSEVGVEDDAKLCVKPEGSDSSMNSESTVVFGV